MSVKVFIDGSSGTTGLRIADRLAARPEIELLSISAEGRKDVNERAKVINSADLAFLCLPDAASKEVMPLLRPDVKVLDTSTAFRTDPAWDYGFPELKGQKEKIKNSYRVAVPGCYASGFISIARPLVELGLAPADYPFSCTGISGYSGGDLVARQLLGAMCLNKTAILPPEFCLMQTAHDPGSVRMVAGIDARITEFAARIAAIQIAQK